MKHLRKLREIMRLAITLALAGVLAPQAWAVEPCCTITAIDAKAGVVTGKDAATGQTVQFEVKDKAALGTLTVGQKFDADFGGMKTGAKGSLKLAGGEAVGIIIVSDLG